MPFPYAALVGAIGSVASQALASSSADSVNEANRNENAANRALTKYMYEDSKIYNSIQNQVKRMRAAGLNPAFALGGLQAGAAQGQGVPSPIANQPPDFSNASSLFGLMNNGLQTDINAKIGAAQAQNLESQTAKNEQETAGLQIDNLFRKENWKSIIYNRDTQSWLNDKLAEVAKLNVAFNKESFQQRLQNLKYDGELKDAQIAAQDIINQFLPHLQSAEYNELVARAACNYATGRSSLQSAHAAIMNAKTAQGEMFAKFGDNDHARREYSKAAFDLLFTQRRHFEAQTFNLGHTTNPIPYNNLSEQKFEDWMNKYVRRR